MRDERPFRKTTLCDIEDIVQTAQRRIEILTLIKIIGIQVYLNTGIQTGIQVHAAFGKVASPCGLFAVKF